MKLYLPSHCDDEARLGWLNRCLTQKHDSESVMGETRLWRRVWVSGMKKVSHCTYL